MVVGLMALCGCAAGGGRIAAEGPVVRARATEVGMASYYARAHDGRPTSSGRIYDEDELTAAHRTLPFGTRVRVTNLVNGRHVVVTITDRGPFRRGRIIDVSRRAARELDFLRAGTTRVRIQTLSG